MNTPYDVKQHPGYTEQEYKLQEKLMGDALKDMDQGQAIFIAHVASTLATDIYKSDGYHTFDELYDHRITLYIALCRALWGLGKVMDEHEAPSPLIWRSKTHSDGSVMEGWFVLGIQKEKGTQMTYHLPMDRWDDTDFAETLDKAPEFDGHSSADVLERLKFMYK